MRKSKVFDGSEPRLALYSSLITHFRRFRKKSKNRCQKEPKSRGFCSKNRPWALQGRLILPFWSIFEDSKNHCFFDVVLGRQKIDKNRALGYRGPAKTLRPVAGWDTLVTGAPRAAAIIKDIQGIKAQGLQSRP